MYFKIIGILFFFQISVVSGSNNSYLNIDLHPYSLGMFCIFNYVTGVLHEYDSHNYAGIEIDFKDVGLYYDPKYGPNWWEYYCEPICIGNKENHIQKFTKDEYATYARLTRKMLNREEVYSLIQKYIHVKEVILEKVEQFLSENFTDSYIIGVHFRGTDKILEAPRVAYHEVSNYVKKFVRNNYIENFKIFVASDESQFIDFMRETFGDLVIAYQAVRSNNYKPLHMTFVNNYLLGEQALIDCLLLSKTDVLIRTSSNLSLWSSFFNPKIPVITLNERYEFCK